MVVWVAVGAVAAVCLFRFYQSFRQHLDTGGNDGNLISYIKGDYLDTSKCEIEWGENKVVGGTFSFLVKFFANNGEPFPISDADDVNIRIEVDAIPITCVIEYIASGPDVVNVIKASFVLRRSGRYEIMLNYGEIPLLQSPYFRYFEPGWLSARHTQLVRSTHSMLSTVTMVEVKQHEMKIVPKDEFDNNCCCRLGREDFDEKFNFQLTDVSNSDSIPPFLWNVEGSSSSRHLFLTLTIFEAGCYVAELSYDGQTVKNGCFDIIVLTSSEFSEVEENVQKPHIHVWFECRLMDSSAVEGIMEVPCIRTSDDTGRHVTTATNRIPGNQSMNC